MKEQGGVQAVDDGLDPMYTVGYVAGMFSVTEQTVRNWIKSGKLKATRVNRQWRIPRRALLAFANSTYGA